MCRKCLFCEKEEGELFKVNSLEEVYFQRDSDIDYDDIEYKEEFELEFYNSDVLLEIIDDISLGVCELCLDDFKYQLIDRLSKECSIREMIDFIEYMLMEVIEGLNISMNEYMDYSIDKFYRDIHEDKLFQFLDKNCRDKYIIIRQYLGLTIEKLSSYQYTNNEMNQNILSKQ